jgi:DNA-binding LytR/AlgR family response regulator
MLKVIIVDDEPLALDVMEALISKVPELEIVARCQNAIEANDALSKFHVDLMFLDIQMPQVTGIELLKSLTNPPEVIFTTAYSDYALDGFELNALDYLLKPISLDRFLKAVNKAKDKFKSKSSEVSVAEDEPFVFVKADKKLIKVNFDDILYIEGLKDYVIIRQEASRVITLQTMKSLEQKLPSQVFKRIHRSYIVNVNKINAVVGNMIELTEKGQAKHLPIGKNYREELLELVNQNRL